jgi:hypothetical protein
MVDHYALSDEELARIHCESLLYVLLGHGGLPAKIFLTYLEGVWEAREDGQSPPFQVGDWVRRKSRRAGAPVATIRIERMYYFGDGLWQLKLLGDPVTHLARHFRK